MSIRNFFPYFLIFNLLLIPLCAPYSFAGTGTIEVLKNRLAEMETEMIMMKRKIAELEFSNKRLERQSKGITADTQALPEDVYTGTVQQPVGQTFLGRAFQTLNPDISVIGLFAGAWYSEDEPQVLAEGDPENTGFNVQEVELGFQSVVDPYFKFDSFISFGEHIELEEAYATTIMSLPLNSQFRTGVMRSKFGRINQQHRHNQSFVTLPLPAAEFLGAHFNPASVEANFLLPVPWYMELSASMGSPEVETASFDRDEDANSFSKFLYTSYLSNFFEIGESLSVLIGGSFATGPNNTEPGNGNRTNLYGVDFFAKYRPIKSDPYKELRLQSEFFYRDAETEGTDRQDWGFYAETVYRFAKRWDIGARYALTDTDDPVMMEEAHEEHEHDEEDHDEEEHEEGEHDHDHGDGGHMHADEDMHDGHDHGTGILGLFGKRQKISTMLTFTPTEFSKIRLEYNYLDPDFDEEQHGVFLQFQYAIGAHGAHPF